MEAKAQLRHLRVSPRKVRLVANVIKSLPVIEAEEQLQFVRKASAPMVLKLLRSAIANAVHNLKIKKEHLYVKAIFVDEGYTLKRWQPRAQGRATPIKKKSSHVTIVLAEKKNNPSTLKASKGKKNKAK
jgi:large subunit ribosomal protein L22